MPLLVNLRHLETKALDFQGILSLEELDIDPLDPLIHLSQPLAHDLHIEKYDKAILVQGSLELVLDCVCGRCLKAFHHPLRIENWACHIPLEGEEKAEVLNDCVDLTPFIRDDILLAFPQQPLCEPGCKGLPLPKEKAHGGEGEQEMSSSAWAELNKLKLK